MYNTLYYTLYYYLYSQPVLTLMSQGLTQEMCHSFHVLQAVPEISG